MKPSGWKLRGVRHVKGHGYVACPFNLPKLMNDNNDYVSVYYNFAYVKITELFFLFFFFTNSILCTHVAMAIEEQNSVFSLD